MDSAVSSGEDDVGGSREEVRRDLVLVLRIQWSRTSATNLEPRKYVWYCIFNKYRTSDNTWSVHDICVIAMTKSLLGTPSRNASPAAMVPVRHSIFVGLLRSTLYPDHGTNTSIPNAHTYLKTFAMPHTKTQQAVNSVPEVTATRVISTDFQLVSPGTSRQIRR